MSNPQRMAETAVHLVDHVFPSLPLRQRMLQVPRRLRWLLEREAKAVIAVLHLFLQVIEGHLRRNCPGASAQARCEVPASSIVSALPSIVTATTTVASSTPSSTRCKPAGGQFRPVAALVPEEVAVIEAQVRRRMLR